MNTIQLKSILLAAMMCLTVLLSFSGCAEFSPQATPTPEAAPENDFTPIANATGIVIPAQWANLSMQASGVVESIFISEGDKVTAGDVLIRLKGSEAQKAAITSAQIEVVASGQALDDILENAEIERSAAQLALAEAQKAYDKALERRQSKEFLHGDQDDIDMAYAAFILAQDKVKQAEKDFEEQAAWRTEDDIIRANYLSLLASARSERDKAIRNYNYLKSLPDEFDQAISTGEVEVAKAILDEALLDWEKLRDKGVDQDAFELAESRAQNAQAQLVAAQAALDNLELKAPFDGTISRLDIHTNEWVNIGQPILLIADLAHLRVETTDLSEIDVARIETGNRATVTFDALAETIVIGAVTHISPKSEGAGVNYKVVIQLDTVPPALRWGMTAFVDIEIIE